MLKQGFLLKNLLLLSLATMTAEAAIKYWDLTDKLTANASVPKTLSELGMFVDITKPQKVVVSEAHHYDVNSALWSDGAHKTRWFVTKPGKSIGFEEKNDYWKYPESTIFLKQFDIDTIPGDTTSRIRWETRVLYNTKELVDSGLTTQRMEDKWYGYTYKWNTDQKDAILVSTRGADDSIRIYPTGKTKPPAWKKWRFPSTAQCNACHLGFVPGAPSRGRTALGFYTAQLNRPHPDLANINQLEYFFRQGWLKGSKPAYWSSAPKWAAIQDSTASIDLRARSYIASNCSGCHGRRGLDQTATGQAAELNYDFFTNQAQMEFRHRLIFKSFSLGDSTVKPTFYNKTSDSIANPLRKDTLRIMPSLVVPGYPQKSTLLYRQIMRASPEVFMKKWLADTTENRPANAPLFWTPYDVIEQMPPLGTYELNNPAIALLTQWITEMAPIDPNPPRVIGIRNFASARTLLKSPTLEGNLLRLPAGLIESNVKVTLSEITGRTIPLNKVGAGIYSIPVNLNRGVYIIRVGNESFTRSRF